MSVFLNKIPPVYSMLLCGIAFGLQKSLFIETDVILHDTFKYM